MTAEPESVHVKLGLTDGEFSEICDLLGRSPNQLELAMYAVMWSEHCSYKSSRRHLERLPTEAPWVLVGPGENAGVIDVGDNVAVAVRIESHNHPSAIEPYQGAATGVGGILRDIFTMGARPIAVLDALRFGSLADARNRWLATGVVSGISGYGNSVGIPTVGGEFVACDTYSNNPLVNVAAIGVLPADKLVLGQASEVGSAVILMGAATGRDGIGGVSVLASAGFGDEEQDAKKLPNVQIGDPFEEKRLIEACLEMLDAKLLSGLQDLGGAGLTCATSETASRGGAGIEVDVSKVPRRQPNMEPFEVMTSESQERMLAIVDPERVSEVLSICEKWELRAAVIGHVTDDGMLRIVNGDSSASDLTGSNFIAAELPATSLTEAAPKYNRPIRPPADLADRQAQDVLATISPTEISTTEINNTDSNPTEINNTALALLTDRCNPAWVYRQYDHQLFLNTVVGPGSDATLLALRHPQTAELTGLGLGVSVDGNHRWCHADPHQGTAALVAEALLNISCVGAQPKALVNCLNFGNPEHPEVMWELSESIDGMTHACQTFGIPVVGGNVSLYNESNGENIAPTPVVCLLGVHPDLQHRPPSSALVSGDEIVLLGPLPEADVPMGGTLWAWERQGNKNGALAQPDLSAIARVGSFVAELVTDTEQGAITEQGEGTTLISAVHDVSEGGVALALLEMACMGAVGCTATAPLAALLEATSPDSNSIDSNSIDPNSIDTAASPPAASAAQSAAISIRALFNEAHGRVLVCVPPANLESLQKLASQAQVSAHHIGRANGNSANGNNTGGNDASRNKGSGDRIQITPQLLTSSKSLTPSQTLTPSQLPVDSLPANQPALDLPLAAALDTWHNSFAARLDTTTDTNTGTNTDTNTGTSTGANTDTNTDPAAQ